ncbi:hypothetical protein JMJ77_0013629 [Colletotrichum scovillei]|uniref:FAD-binding PCMH-type domain-containing protein n=1 Tax=Colletotrichum scovillei TaxID=1209932 RepID=A0A9P7UAN4_9PEZI|nr:hypothetical protein JMJ78_0012918 [Colletotrichum scovillei]KAG7040632.1 hypothetical protein JMJ77_0013629 [Colletotrichum scovillei]KAG7060679.1 hypothetical protein JMJ76_0006222 [Colletotrichum scovillei]
MSVQGPEAACKNLEEAGLQPRLIYSSEDRYRDEVKPHWSLTAQLTPYYVVQPYSTHELSQAVEILAKAEDCIFAVRGGGHCAWAGASNCENGILIDLSKLNGVQYDADRKIVTVQAGCIWNDVYQAIEPHSVTVNGGRDADVGVSGLLCGGGLSWLLPRHGFACDTVVNYEVVLASGDIINANKSDNADLFIALKGGACNFGIVSRFDLEAFEATEVWGGLHICNTSSTSTSIQNFVNYVHNIEEDLDTSYGIMWGWQPSLRTNMLTFVICNTQGVANPPMLAKVLEIPAVVSTVQHQSVASLALNMKSPFSYHNKWLSATFKNSTEILTKAAELHAECVTKLSATIPTDGFSTMCFAQALPTLYAKRSQERGGNVLGVDLLSGNCITFLAAAHIKMEEHVEDGFRILQEWHDDLIQYAKDRELLEGWLYLNYADKSQNPLRAYGEENISKIQAVALKYDPDRVFQEKCPGGFKITNI